MMSAIAKLAFAAALAAAAGHDPVGLTSDQSAGPVAAQAAEEPPLPRRAGPMGVRLENPRSGTLQISAVVPGSPAAKAGIEAGMRLVEVNGRPAALREDVQAAMRTVMAGMTVPVKAQRGEEPPRGEHLCNAGGGWPGIGPHESPRGQRAGNSSHAVHSWRS